MNNLTESELILRPDGSIYHLALRPDQVADTILTVGDPGRVANVSKHFDRIEHSVQHREFITHTGSIGSKRLSVISTGIGTDNIDIVLNELDALVNLDFATRAPKPILKSLNIIRLGTSGAIQVDIPVDSLLASEGAVGLDNLLLYYDGLDTFDLDSLQDAMVDFVENQFDLLVIPYAAAANSHLLQLFADWPKGITLTAPGFYGPQMRQLRARTALHKGLEKFQRFRHKGHRITNLEMETAGLYGLGKLLGHRCLSLNAILANRATGEFSADPQKAIDALIEKALEVILHEKTYF